MKKNHVYKNKTTYLRSPNDKDHPYTVISNQLIKDERLSFIAIGLMVFILSQSDSYVINKAYLLKISGVPKNKFNDAWKQLVELGYISSVQIQSGVEWIITETPESTMSTRSNTECSKSECSITKGGQLISNNNKEVTIERNKKMNIKEYSPFSTFKEGKNGSKPNNNTLNNSIDNPSTDLKSIPYPTEKVTYGSAINQGGKEKLYCFFETDLTKEEVKSKYFQLPIEDIDDHTDHYILKSTLSTYPNYNSKIKTESK